MKSLRIKYKMSRLSHKSMASNEVIESLKNLCNSFRLRAPTRAFNSLKSAEVPPSAAANIRSYVSSLISAKNERDADHYLIRLMDLMQEIDPQWASDGVNDMLEQASEYIENKFD